MAETDSGGEYQCEVQQIVEWALACSAQTGRGSTVLGAGEPDLGTGGFCSKRWQILLEKQ